MNKQTEYGKLYVVATPIGNLKDITFRAVETLHTVDTILAEDTRKTKILLKHYHITTPLWSYRDQNHTRIFPKILKYMHDGINFALVSDNGTPLISDPGFKLVHDLLESNIEIIPIPGPSAITASLSIAGLPTDKCTFLGFLPKSKAKRKNMLETYGNQEVTLVLYESPFRMLKLLKQIQETLGDRKVCICNEITKKFEKQWRGTAKELIQQLGNEKIKGEFVVLIAKEDF